MRANTKYNLIRFGVITVIILSVLALDIGEYMPYKILEYVVPAALAGLSVFVVMKALDHAFEYHKMRK